VCVERERERRAMALVFWSIIVVVFLAVEIHTQAFVAFFLGVSGVVAGVLAIAGVAFWLQVLVWLGVTGLGLWLLRPFALAKFPRHRYERDMTKPSAVAMTNLRGVTESLVGDEENPGRVRIQGESWKAVTEGEPIPTGAPITVRKAYGTTLWVEKQTL
jgi:membrane protein implicated in regulation of membrane protease activity